jgi:integrase
MSKVQSPDGRRRPGLHAELTLSLVKRLRLEDRPVGFDHKGRPVTAPNPTRDPYIVWDTHRDAPPGFGIKVASKKTYVIRRKVLGRSLMPTVGNVADFHELGAARDRARELARVMVDTRANPNKLAREEVARQLTLGDAFRRYRHHLATRTEKPAKENTLKTYDKSVRRFDRLGWNRRHVQDLLGDEILRAFQEGKSHPTANESAFRWASRAVKWCIDIDAHDAALQRRDPVLKVNPFNILVVHRAYRSKEQLEREREERGVRNPLGPMTTLGRFLEVAWARKHINDSETGVHYLILMLLWGCRASEHAACKWGELLQETGPAGVGRQVTSHVWLHDDGRYGPYVLIYMPKNGKSHRLPLTPMALQLLRIRQASAAREALARGFGAKSRAFVFPARNRYSSTGHYADATDLLDRIREQAGIPRLTRHDLRRTFGSVMTSLGVDPTIRRRFLNHANADVTDIYTQAEWALLRREMERIEHAILSTAPNVFNALKPEDWAPLQAPEPFEWPPAKPRSGRPPKMRDEQSLAA